MNKLTFRILQISSRISRDFRFISPLFMPRARYGIAAPAPQRRMCQQLVTVHEIARRPLVFVSVGKVKRLWNVVTFSYKVSCFLRALWTVSRGSVWLVPSNVSLARHSRLRWTPHQGELRLLWFSVSSRKRCDLRHVPVATIALRHQDASQLRRPFGYEESRKCGHGRKFRPFAREPTLGNGDGWRWGMVVLQSKVFKPLVYVVESHSSPGRQHTMAVVLALALQQGHSHCLLWDMGFTHLQSVCVILYLLHSQCTRDSQLT